jgi:hypothetical protein
MEELEKPPDLSVSREDDNEKEQDSKEIEETITLHEALKVITDKYCAKILVATSDEPKSAIELSYRHGIPIAACYRRIRLLKKSGVIKCANKVQSKKGKEISMYVSMLKNGAIFFDDGKFHIKFELKSGNSKEFVGEHPEVASLKDEDDGQPWEY